MDGCARRGAGGPLALLPGGAPCFVVSVASFCVLASLRGVPRSGSSPGSAFARPRWRCGGPVASPRRGDALPNDPDFFVTAMPRNAATRRHRAATSAVARVALAKRRQASAARALAPGCRTLRSGRQKWTGVPPGGGVAGPPGAAGSAGPLRSYLAALNVPPPAAAWVALPSPLRCAGGRGAGPFVLPPLPSF